MFYSSKLGKIKKQQKSAFPTLGKSKNATGCISHPLESQKCRKSFVARERNAEIAKNSISLVSDEQKTLKTAFRS